GVTPRKRLIDLGDEVKKEHGENFLAKNLMAQIRERTEEGGDDRSRLAFIISDIRYKNEVRGLRDEGGSVLRVNGKQNVGEHSKHASEQPLPKNLVDFEIDNTGTKPNLFRQLDTYISLEI